MNPENHQPQSQPQSPPAPQTLAQTALKSPQTVVTAVAPTVVHVARPLEPAAQLVSPEVARRHERSARVYPNLNLSAGEFVISAVRRHPIGLIAQLSLGTILIGVALAVLFNYQGFVETLSITGPFAEVDAVTLPILFLVAISALVMFVAYYVYVKNRFYLTNESVIQEIQQTLFARTEQTVSLANIEDASYSQAGILQQLFDYGDIRLSTEGDETTYRFSYVARPKEHIARLNNAVEAFKNGRPVDID